MIKYARDYVILNNVPKNSEMGTMSLTGKIIKIYVRGNTPRSLRSIEMVNWSGKAFTGNRSHLKQLRDIPELTETGIYFLLRTNEESGLTDIYIGETDTVSQRMNQHTSKDWWDTFIVFLSRDLTKAHVRYLESKMYQLANQSVSTLKVMNEGVPPGSKLPEPDMCAMEEFASNMIFTLETLGLGLFNVIAISENVTEVSESPNHFKKNYDVTHGMEFYMNLPRETCINGEKATMVVDNGSFILKAGSFIRKEVVDSFPESSYFELWKQIVNSNAVKAASNPNLFQTIRDLEFKSPSAAGAVVKGRTTNGRANWKRTSDEKSLFDCESEDAA